MTPALTEPSRVAPGAPGRGFDPLAYKEPSPSPWLIRFLGPVNRHLVLPHLLKLRAIVLPRADLERLRATVRPGTAAFLGPNHPEFMTDWMLDKEISRRVSPLMAHWASWEIVNLNPWVQWLWLRNNLISNAPGGGGKEYSVRWALAGHGVLLHPEGTATWHADRVGALVSGIVDMAWETCRRTVLGGSQTPVYVVPIVWKLHFTSDISSGLHREMGHIERTLSLSSGAGLSLSKRFAALQRNVLLKRCERFGFTPPGADLTDRTFFEIQQAFAGWLLKQLQQRHGPTEGDLGRALHALRRSIRERAAADPEGSRRDRAMMLEIERLHHFAPEIYDVPTLTQEQIAETLKQTRSALLTRGWREFLHNLVPVAVAPRAAHVRVPEPLAIHEAFDRVTRATGPDPSTGNAATLGEQREKTRLLELLRDRMQRSLDDLIRELTPAVDSHRQPNPLHTGG